uniref:Uncharacterized protein n=1 Tax=Setaria viridis TaxID=4556 RepID=A0A4U6TY20_SETVI|nr:hypothetical protein SEVIR_6G003300v2 [Setaria viridis]
MMATPTELTRERCLDSLGKKGSSLLTRTRITNKPSKEEERREKRRASG